MLQLGHEWVISFKLSMQKGIKQHRWHQHMQQIQQASHCIPPVDHHNNMVWNDDEMVGVAASLIQPNQG